jgi:hypothetical protein
MAEGMQSSFWFNERFGCGGKNHSTCPNDKADNPWFHRTDANGTSLLVTAASRHWSSNCQFGFLLGGFVYLSGK